MVPAWQGLVIGLPWLCPESRTSPWGQGRGVSPQADSGFPERGAHAGPPAPRSLFQGHRVCLFLGPPRMGTCSLPPPPQKGFPGFLRGPAAGLFWRPLHTLVPKSTPSALGEAALCQQADGRCEGSHSGQGGGWAGPRPLAGNENTTRPLHAAPFPPMFPQPDHPQGLAGTQREGRERRTTGQRPALKLAPRPWACSRGPCTTCPGRKSGWRTSWSRAGGKQTQVRPALSHREQAEQRQCPPQLLAGPGLRSTF